MSAPTYEIRQPGSSVDECLTAVRQLADWVMEAGEGLAPVVDAYGDFIASTGREARRSFAEYLLEALVLGVLWRARGSEATESSPQRQRLVTEIVRERRAGMGKRRDASTAGLVQLPPSPKGAKHEPSPTEIQQLLNWLLATGEYDDECKRLDGWGKWLSSPPQAAGHEILRFISAFAMLFERRAQHALGKFTNNVERFIAEELSARPPREDTAQCSRRSVEYHLNMVGAEILNRAWRKDFLACRRHVVVMPGCARIRQDSTCKAKVGLHELECTHCTVGCAVSSGTRQAERTFSQAFAVLHGSDFSRFLASSALAGGGVGIVGIACAPGLLGAGWRARDKGLPAQCVLLNASGCQHWTERARPTSFDVEELARILERPCSKARMAAAPRVA